VPFLLRRVVGESMMQRSARTSFAWRSGRFEIADVVYFCTKAWKGKRLPIDGERVFVLVTPLESTDSRHLAAVDSSVRGKVVCRGQLGCDNLFFAASSGRMRLSFSLQKARLPTSLFAHQFAGRCLHVPSSSTVSSSEKARGRSS